MACGDSKLMTFNSTCSTFGFLYRCRVNVPMTVCVTLMKNTTLGRTVSWLHSVPPHNPESNKVGKLLVSPHALKIFGQKF